MVGYANYVDIQVANPTSPSTALTDFPLPLRLLGNVPTAHLTAATFGDDIRVTSADGLDTPIPYGLKTYVVDGTSSGYTDLYILCNVIIPGGSGTVLTVRVYYNNPSAANGETHSDICDSNTLLNMPMGGSGGSVDTADWTGNNSPIPTNVTAATGDFGGAASFDGSTSGILFGAFPANVRRMSCWFNSADQSSYHFLAAASDVVLDPWEWSCTEAGDGRPYAYLQAPVSQYCPKFGTAIGTGVWKRLSFALDASAGAVGYDNGSADGTNSLITTALPTINAWNIGRRSDGYFFNGLISDFKVETSGPVRAAWDYAEYAYGLNGTYLSQGSEQQNTGSTGAIFSGGNLSRAGIFSGGRL